MKARRLLVLSSLIAISAASWPGPTASAAACDVQPVPGIGPACRHADGYYEVFGRDGQSLGFTHGYDYASGEGGGITATPQPPRCVEGVPEFQLDRFYAVVIHARAADDVDNYAANAPNVRNLVHQAQGLLMESANQLGRSLWYRVQCAGGVVQVHNAVLPTPLAQTTFSTIQEDLLDLGFRDKRNKLWVYFDDTSPCVCAGLGFTWTDERLDGANFNNGNTGRPQMAVTFGRMDAGIMMHENGHTMGAVQLGAPHTSGAGHCNDGLDIMCYNDGGPQSNYNPNVCAVTVFDCGHDDYFHPDVLDASYLGSHWNTGSPLNRYMEGCFDATDHLLGPTPGVYFNYLGWPAMEYDIPPACIGHVYAVQVLPHLDGQVVNGQHTPSITVAGDVDACWFNGNVLLRCDATVLGSGGEMGRVPAGINRLDIRHRNGPGVDYLVRIV